MRKTWVYLLVATLLISLIANCLLCYQVVRYYHKYNILRLDPLELNKINSNVSQTNSNNINKLKLVVLGDSRAKQWVRPFVYNDLEIINVGIGGQTSSQVLERYDYHVKPIKPKYLLIQVGVNDLKNANTVHFSNIMIIDQYKRNIRALIRKALSDDTCVILSTIFPTSRPSLLRSFFWKPSTYDIFDKMNNFLRTIKMQNVYIFDAEHILKSTTKYILMDYSINFLHLSFAGYNALNQALELPSCEQPQEL